MTITAYILTEAFESTKSIEHLDQYLQIVNEALLAKRRRYPRDDPRYTYYEQHHILPKSLYPQYTKDKANLVLLTAEEHFECHRLLVEIFPTPEMIFAYLLMSRHGNLSSEDFAVLKQKYAIAISNKLKGVPKTDKHRKHISESRLGLSYGALSEEHRQKISVALKGTIPSELNRAICSERCKKRTSNKNTQSRKVRCIEDDLIFDTVGKCEQHYNILHLYRYCATGKAHSKINKHFEYVKED
jgi:hypothetical protein